MFFRITQKLQFSYTIFKIFMFMKEALSALWFRKKKLVCHLFHIMLALFVRCTFMGELSSIFIYYSMSSIFQDFVTSNQCVLQNKLIISLLYICI